MHSGQSHRVKMVFTVADDVAQALEKDKDVSGEITSIPSHNVFPSRSRRREFSKPSVDRNNCYGDPLDFSSPDWRTHFDAIQQCYSSNYSNRIPEGPRKEFAAFSYSSSFIPHL